MFNFSFVIFQNIRLWTLKGTNKWNSLKRKTKQNKKKNRTENKNKCHADKLEKTPATALPGLLQATWLCSPFGSPNLHRVVCFPGMASNPCCFFWRYVTCNTPSRMTWNATGHSCDDICIASVFVLAWGSFCTLTWDFTATTGSIYWRMRLGWEALLSCKTVEKDTDSLIWEPSVCSHPDHWHESCVKMGSTWMCCIVCRESTEDSRRVTGYQQRLAETLLQTSGQGRAGLAWAKWKFYGNFSPFLP